jgi:hypothetical protein
MENKLSYPRVEFFQKQRMRILAEVMFWEVTLGREGIQ